MNESYDRYKSILGELTIWWLEYHISVTIVDFDADLKRIEM